MTTRCLAPRPSTISPSAPTSTPSASPSWATASAATIPPASPPSRSAMPPASPCRRCTGTSPPGSRRSRTPTGMRRSPWRNRISSGAGWPAPRTRMKASKSPGNSRSRMWRRTLRVRSWSPTPATTASCRSRMRRSSTTQWLEEQDHKDIHHRGRRRRARPCRQPPGRHRLRRRLARREYEIAAPPMTNPIPIRMGGYGPPTTGFSQSIKFIGDRLQQQFGDRVDVKYCWNIMDFGYKAEEILWLVESGILTLGYQSSSYLTDRVPELGFVDLPFLFTDNDHARGAMDGALGRRLVQAVESKANFRILGWYENGFRHISNRVRTVRTPADLKDMAIRVLPSQIQKR